MIGSSKIDDLESQIAVRRREISTEQYGMSVSELCSLYREGELIIHPEFQRFFRWNEFQKSRLIESILLGIPLPSIFVAQAEDGKWELVDGLQRVSTLLELQGMLLGADGKKKKPLQLRETKYLPALEGRQWESTSAESNTLTDAQKRDIKRARIDVQIIQRQSSPDTKYDLFQRLNSYGSQLTAQELRSCLLVSVNAEFLKWVEHLSSSHTFRQTVSLSERLIDQQYDVELVLRFLILHNRASLRMSDLRNFTQVLDDEAVLFASAFPENQAALESVFTKTFKFINDNGGEDVFRKYDAGKDTFVGSFLNTSYEVFAMGLGHSIANGVTPQLDLLGAVQSFWARPEMSGGFATGMSTESRLARYMPIGRQIFSPGAGKS